MPAPLSRKKHGITVRTGVRMNGTHGKHGAGIDSSAGRYVHPSYLHSLFLNCHCSIRHTSETIPPRSGLCLSPGSIDQQTLLQTFSRRHGMWLLGRRLDARGYLPYSCFYPQPTPPRHITYHSTYISHLDRCCLQLRLSINYASLSSSLNRLVKRPMSALRKEPLVPAFSFSEALSPDRQTER
jgi:hypothetical protein